jgi:hypothetical protein
MSPLRLTRLEAVEAHKQEVTLKEVGLGGLAPVEGCSRVNRSEELGH